MLLLLLLLLRRHKNVPTILTATVDGKLSTHESNLLFTAARLAQLGAGLVSGRSRVRILAGPTLRVLKITKEKVLSLQ